MGAEGHIVEAMVDELKRQSANSGGTLKVEASNPEKVGIEGAVNLEELAQVVLGAAAGGP